MCIFRQKYINSQRIREIDPSREDSYKSQSSAQHNLSSQRQINYNQAGHNIDTNGFNSQYGMQNHANHNFGKNSYNSQYGMQNSQVGQDQFDPHFGRSNYNGQYGMPNNHGNQYQIDPNFGRSNHNGQYGMPNNYKYTGQPNNYPFQPTSEEQQRIHTQIEIDWIVLAIQKVFIKKVQNNHDRFFLINRLKYLVKSWEEYILPY